MAAIIEVQRGTLAEIGFFLNVINGTAPLPLNRFQVELRLLKSIHHKWLANSDILGVGIGSANERIKSKSKISVKVYLQNETAKLVEKIPDQIEFPVFGAVPTEIELSPMSSAQHFNYQFRPVQPGCSISHRNLGRGTACAKVTRTIGNRKNQGFILSCQHVLFPNKSANHSSHFVVQPCQQKFRQTRNKDIVAWRYLHANIQWNGINEVDAAIGLLRADPETLMTNQIAQSHFLISGIETEPVVGDLVEFYGSQSGKQNGQIVAISNAEPILYELPTGNRIVQFHNMIKCRYPNQKGDSGGPVVLSKNKKLIGMHFAGSGNVAHICKIDRVFNALNIKLKR